jgi:hypothetical protein
MDLEVLGRIDIVVMKNGKAPMKVEGLDEWQILNVLSSQIHHINMRMAEKPMKLDDQTKGKLYKALKDIFGTEDGFPIINALAWCLNRIAARMARDKKKEEPIILSPDAWGGPFM